MAKNEEKPCSTCLKPHFSADSEYTRKSDLGFSDPSLIARSIILLFTILKRSFQNDRRNQKEDRNNTSRRPSRASRKPEDHMERFRVAVGYRDRVKPGNLVGAIANESGLQGSMIGRIQIFEEFSLVDLPKGMPKDIYEDLKKLKVMNRELQISRKI